MSGLGLAAAPQRLQSNRERCCVRPRRNRWSRAKVDFDDGDLRVAARCRSQGGHGDVVNRSLAACLSLPLTAVRMPMKDCRDVVADQRLFEAARSQETEDLGGLALHGFLDRRVMQN